ncbi:MAG: glycosidase [Acidimicrobiaceae bacterium]|nr:glycosidase [Acidimicrobiaceae bacterium]
MSHSASAPGERRWWEGSVLYQCYVRSFADSNGDGYGDLPGLVAHLDYLEWLGVDGVWLSPTMPSPDHDWGYDVSDYLGVHPELGTLDDLDALIKSATERKMRVLLDLVPNHTSSEHAWFVEALGSRDAKTRDYYVWADPGPDGEPPNNWLDATGESGWTLDEASGQYYFHNFLESQPDLNWWNPQVHAAFEQVLSYWFDRGVAGFRIDVAHGLYKDAQLRDNPPVQDPGDLEGRFGFDRIYSMNRPETHEVYRQWREMARSYAPERLLLGETWVFEPDRLARYYGEDDELQLGFNFPFAFAPLEAEVLAKVVGDTVSALGTGCPVWMASNHDIGRFASRWGAGDERRTRLGLLLLTMLPGTVVLYYGDEIGMTDVAVPPALQRDPMTMGNRGNRPVRDRGRTPLPWDDTAGRGFTRAAVDPWLPIGEVPGGSVAAQRAEPGSMLGLTRELLALRREHLSGSVAPYGELEVASDRWIFSVGPLVVAANFSGVAIRAALPPGADAVRCSSNMERERAVVQGLIELGPYEGVVISS